MKPPKTMGELRQQLGVLFAGAVNGDVDEKRGRTAINAATRIIESFQAETRSRIVATQLKETVHELGAQPLNISNEK